MLGPVQQHVLFGACRYDAYPVSLVSQLAVMKVTGQAPGGYGKENWQSFFIFVLLAWHCTL